MGESNRTRWIPTTHDWTHDVDIAHLDEIQRDRLRYEAGGRRHQMLEVLAYADDEAAALERVGVATVHISQDDSVSIADDGRGTDTRTDSNGTLIRKPIMATKDLRFFDATTPPVLSDGLPRRGISTVSALSSLLTHENRRTEGAWFQEYRHGFPTAPVCNAPRTPGTGTTVSFRSELGAPTHLTDADLRAFQWLEIRYTVETA